MSRIVLATDSTDLEERVHKATDGAFFALPPGPLPLDPAHLFGQLENLAPPKVVLIDAGLGLEAALDLAGNFGQHCPAISIVLVSELGPEIGLAAMRAGVRDILHPTADVAEFKEVLDRAFQTATDLGAVPDPSGPSLSPGGPSTRTGRVISVVSPKGGVGKTTVATNLAVGLASTGPNSTVLVDLDVQFGDVSSALNLEPEYTLPDTVHGPASRDAMVLKTFLTQHDTGLYVICGSQSPAEADNVTAQDISRLLEVLASEFQYVVVDTAPGLAEHAMAAMDQSTDLLLVTSMDVPGVRGLRKELDTLTDLGMLLDARHVVLNFANSHAGLSLADVEATIGRAVDLTLPWSKAIPTSVNQGIPLLQSGVRDPMTKQLRQLVGRFAATPLAHGAKTSTRQKKQAKLRPAGPAPRRAVSGWSRLRGVGVR